MSHAKNPTNHFRRVVMKALDEARPEQLARSVKFANIQESGYEAFDGAFARMAHMRGQCEVYLRLQNILPPKYPFE
jgi:hypothetical protein